jgi:RNA-directed DNA polymerase
MIGSQAEALEIMGQLRTFLERTLHLKVSETKSQTLHIREGFRYLGYTVKGYSGQRKMKTKREGRYTTMRSNHDVINLLVPEAKIRAVCQKHRYGNYATHTAWHKNSWLRRSDVEIILAYNAQLRGFAHYYSLADNAKRGLSRLSHLHQLSLLKTLAGKHQTSVRKIYKRLRLKQGLGLQYQVHGQGRTIRIFRLSDLKKSPQSFAVDRIPNIYPFTMNRSELVQRLNANRCEYCGTDRGYFEVHHVRRLRDTQGKELWQRVMAAMRRKTLVLCVTCHDKLHTGTLPPRKVA